MEIYRIMHHENLVQLLENEGQYSRKEMLQKDIDYYNISNNGIQDRRANLQVPGGNGRVLHDYVPFYFTNRSPMLYACHTGYASDYEDGQEAIIYLVSNIQVCLEEDLNYIFTDGQANSNGSSFYTDLDDLDKIDWELINHWSWKNTNEDMDRRRRKQAEFLVADFFPIDLITEIVVENVNMQRKVCEILNEYDYDILVNVKRNWYY